MPDQPALPSLKVGELLRCAERESEDVARVRWLGRWHLVGPEWADVLHDAHDVLKAIPHASVGDAGPTYHHHLTLRVARMRAHAQSSHPVNGAVHPAMNAVALGHRGRELHAG